MKLQESLILKKYHLLLFIIGSITCFSIIFTLLFTFTMKNDGNIINQVGYQRMLLQKMALLTKLLHEENDEVNIKKMKDNIKIHIHKFKETHEKIKEEYSDNLEIKAILYGSPYYLDNRAIEFTNIFSKIQSSEIMHSQNLNFFENENYLILEGSINDVVHVLEREFNHKILALIYLQLAMMLLLILSLALTHHFIIKPMTNEIAQKTKTLEHERNYINLLLDIAKISNESPSFELAIEKTLKIICEFTSWPIGHAYKISKSDPGTLESSKIWYLSEQNSFQEFKLITEKLSFKKGFGLPGRVLINHHVAWIDDIYKDKNFPRKEAALQNGLRSAYAIPITFRFTTVAILEFFTQEIISRDEWLIKISDHVGRQLSLVFKRVYVENQLKEINQTLENRVNLRTKELEKSHEEIKKQQEILFNASKMSSLGEMAGGIAHEINNPLAFISLRAEQIQELIESNELNRDFIFDSMSEISSTTNSISNIIKGLKTFSRDGKNDPFQKISIQTLIEETLIFCKEKFKNSNILLKIEYPQIDQKIECRPTQISQVIINLLNNAFDAVSQLSEKWIKLECLYENPKIKLIITDSGLGIPQEIQNKLMTPFFTTKEIGKGTGLGLSISKGIISSHNGLIYINNKTENTQFIIELPLTQTKKERDSA